MMQLLAMILWRYVLCKQKGWDNCSYMEAIDSDPKTKVSPFRKVEHHVVNDDPLSFSLCLCTGQPS